MSGVYKRNSLGKQNYPLEQVLFITYKNGKTEQFSFIDYATVLDKKMLYIRIDGVQDAKIPLGLIKQIDERVIII